MPAIVHEVLQTPGQPLDAAARTFMEPRFGHDFGSIRVHADRRAGLSAAAVGARAYTVGRHIVMGSGEYRVASPAGRRLLAHELTHTIQQGDGARVPAGNLTLGDPDTSAEREAERAAGMAAGPDPFMTPAGQPLEISRQTDSVQRECLEDGNGVKHWKYEYDGCSLPAMAALTFGGLTLGGAAKDNPAGGPNTAFSRMTSTREGGGACDRHDECYQSCTATKDQCDARMLEDMEATCAQASPEFRLKCFSVARLYYKGLTELPQAQAAFDGRKKQVCDCDSSALPPAERFPPLELLRSPRGGFLSWLDYQLSREKLAGYKVFRDQEQYDQYLRAAGAPAVKPAGALPPGPP